MTRLNANMFKTHRKMTLRDPNMIKTRRKMTRLTKGFYISKARRQKHVWSQKSYDWPKRKLFI